jgi:hypothetical protein
MKFDRPDRSFTRFFSLIIVLLYKSYMSMLNVSVKTRNWLLKKGSPGQQNQTKKIPRQSGGNK